MSRLGERTPTESQDLAGVRVQFRVLGRPEVRIDGERLDLGAPKQQTVLAALLFSTNEVVSGDRLTEAVWWKPPAAAHANARGYLARLRRLLWLPGEQESRMHRMHGGHRLRVLAGELDLNLFEELASQGEQALGAGRLQVAADRFEQARQLWRGPALESMAYGPGLQVKVARLEERRLAVAEQWAQAQVDLGHHERLVVELRGLVAEHPLRERLWAYLMIALHRSGRQAEAVAAYAQVRAVLAEELGTDPGPELQRLHEKLLRGDALVPSAPVGSALAADIAITIGDGGTDGGQPGDLPDGRAVVSPRQLPAGPSAFCGRTGELLQLQRLVDGIGNGHDPAVVAIDGTAGVGKSALALATAHRVAGSFPDGQLYVDLQGATPGVEPLQPIEVLGRFLRALDVRPGTVPSDEAEAAALFRSLVATRRILVILDDAASAAQVRPLLPGGPCCAALITSRNTLTGLMHATRLHLDLLSPAESVSLLQKVAGPARIAAEPAAAARLAALCGHLPLALRIAGARLAARPGWLVAGLADRLAADRYRLDELSVADIAVRTSIGVTYRGLAEDSRRALRYLSLLRARDFAPWALAALLDVPPARADRLVDGLLTVHLLEIASTGPGEPRYRFHDLVRLFARERAAEEDQPEVRAEALRRMVDACLDLAERADLRLGADFLGIARHRVKRWGLPEAEVERLIADPGAWFDREHAFLVTAVTEGLDIGATSPAGCLAVSLTAFFQLRNHFDDWRRVQTTALMHAVKVGDHCIAMRLHRGLGELDTIQDRYADAIGHFETALGLGAATDPQYEAALTAGLGYLHRVQGEYETALRYFTQAHRLADKTRNLNGLVYAANGIGVVQLERGRLAEAAEHFNECLHLSQRADYLPGEAQSLRCLAQVHRASHEYDAAAELFIRAGQISEALGDRLGEAHALCWLGEMRFRQGRHVEGRRLLARCLWVYRAFGNAWGEAATLWKLAEAHLAVARPRPARARANRAVAIWRRIGSPYWLTRALETLAEAQDGIGQHDAAERTRQEAAALRRQLAAGERHSPSH